MVMARPCSQVAGIGLSLAPQHPGGWTISDWYHQWLGMGQNPVALVSINIAGKWMSIPYK